MTGHKDFLPAVFAMKEVVHILSLTDLALKIVYAAGVPKQWVTRYQSSAHT